MEWVGLFIIVVILGALLGGDTFGSTVRKGCGAVAVLLLIVVVLGLLALSSA